MKASRGNLKDIPCAYRIGDMFTDGNLFYTIINVTTRDEYKAILKEPRYTIKKNPEELYRNGKLFLKLKEVEMLESQITKLLGLTWEKIN